MKLAVLSDLHFCPGVGSIGSRRADLADILLLRCVHRLNRFHKPDCVVLLGDLINDGNAEESGEQFALLRQTLDKLEAPWFALPGNHDADPERFFEYFPELPDWFDIQGVRLVPFVDPEEPGYNARRENDNLQRLTAARQNWNGALVTLQHVPILPPNTTSCPYNYVNTDAVIASMRQAGVDLAIAGHYHHGVDLFPQDEINYLVAPAICESPFRYLLVDIDEKTMTSTTEQLAMPQDFGLIDTHVHTQLAYCSENMEISRTLALAEAFNLGGVVFSEHSGHLLFDRAQYSQCCQIGASGADGENNRFPTYLQKLREGNVPHRSFGMELDAGYDGTPVVHTEQRQQIAFEIGAVHQLAAVAENPRDPEKIGAELLSLLDVFLPCGIRALAHPFRIFRRAGLDAPPKFFAPVAELLHRHGVAAEINFHTNQPPLEFIKICLEMGIPFTFGSDAHNLYEVGEFYPHLALLREAGHDGNPNDVSLSIPGF